MPTLDRQDNVFVLASVDVDLDEAGKAQGPRAAVAAATGRFYSNGLDLEWLDAHADQHENCRTRVHGLFARVLSLAGITVATLQGHPFAAGAMFPLADDFRVMRADRGYWGLSEADIGIRFTPGMAALIQSRMTLRIAHEAVISARRYSGSDAADPAPARRSSANMPSPADWLSMRDSAPGRLSLR
ncbi:enoyl-CoA hydratase-related protein [Streptomyces sp. PA03-6a]|nr:enoyl-CoA hydratase-related protein [Streptomyces sp. PA03-6a]